MLRLHLAAGNQEEVGRGVRCHTVMAAEKTPSRRKQCIFHKTFQRFPFGRCERKTRSSSNSYDVRHVDITQRTSERWSPTDSSITAPGLHQPQPEGNPELDGSSRTHAPNFQRTNDLNGARGENVVLEPVFVIDHEPNLGHLQQNFIGHYDSMDSLDPPVNGQGQGEVDSAYSSVSSPEDYFPHHVALPPSPSTSSMETDVGIDPETGERAME